MRQLALLLLASVVYPACASSGDEPTLGPVLLLTPSAAEFEQKAPEHFRVRLETSAGDMVLDVHRDWSPLGVDRFYNLVRAGYYDGVRFHRVIAQRWAQFGINGDPAVAQAWRDQTFPDDPFTISNTRGTVAFAFAVPNGRTTQLFLNLRDNSLTHDTEPFTPIGTIVEGMEVADALYAEYGEDAGGGIRGGRQDPLFEGGNAYLEASYPRLDYIVTAKILEG